MFEFLVGYALLMVIGWMLLPFLALAAWLSVRSNERLRQQQLTAARSAAGTAP
jgi:cytochrome bd-type quinol oxidase subunit 2